MFFPQLFCKILSQCWSRWVAASAVCRSCSVSGLLGSTNRAGRSRDPRDTPRGQGGRCVRRKDRGLSSRHYRSRCVKWQLYRWSRAGLHSGGIHYNAWLHTLLLLMVQLNYTPGKWLAFRTSLAACSIIEGYNTLFMSRCVKLSDMVSNYFLFAIANTNCH